MTTSEAPMIADLRTLFLTMGVIGIITGLVVLVWPQATIVVLAVLLGINFLIGGIITIVAGLSRETAGGERTLVLLAGLVSVIAGVVVLARPAQTATFILVVVAAFWVVRGLAELIDGLLDQQVGPRGLAIVGGLISLGAGIVVLAWPDVTLTVLVWIVGLWMVLFGIVRVTLGLSLPRGQTA